MQKELLSDKQGITLITLFMLGSTIILGTGFEAGRDSWLAFLLGMVMAAPIFLIFARLTYLFPDRNLYTILEELLGKYGGRAVGLLYIWYAFHLGSLVTVNFSEYMISVALRNTPKNIPTIMLLLLCVWVIKEGLEVLGRWSSITLPILILFIVLTTLLLIPEINLNNLKPILENGFPRFFKGAFGSFSFPLAETIIVLLTFGSFKKKASPYKIYFSGMLITGIILFIITARNIAVLGPDLLNSSYFPSHIVARRIDVTDFLQRLEILVGVLFIFAGFVKISLCLMATCKGIAGLIRLKDYRVIVTPVAVLMVNFSSILYDSTMEMKAWVTVYKYYALPFQVFIPVTIYVLAEIKNRNRKKNPSKNN